MKQHKMTKEFKSELAKLLTLAVELNRPDFTVFIRYSGHVYQLGIDVHFGGWQPSSDANESSSIYVNDIDNDDGVPNEIDVVKEAIKWLKEASEKNDIRATEAEKKKRDKKRAEYEELKAIFEPEKA